MSHSGTSEVEKDNSLSIPEILANFFLKKIDMPSNSDDSDLKHKSKRKKSRHKKRKHKKSKNRHRSSSSESSSKTSDLNVKSVVDDLSSSEEMEIKRLKKIKNMKRHFTNKCIVDSVECEMKDKSDPNSSTNENPVFYGPSLELLISGLESRDSSLKPNGPSNDLIKKEVKNDDCESDLNVANNSIKNENETFTEKPEGDTFVNSVAYDPGIVKTDSNNSDYVNGDKISQDPKNSFEVSKSDSKTLVPLEIHQCEIKKESTSEKKITNSEPLSSEKCKDGTKNEDTSIKNEDTSIKNEDASISKTKEKNANKRKHSRSRSRSKSQSKHSPPKPKHKKRSSRSLSQEDSSTKKRRHSRSRSHEEKKEHKRSHSRSHSKSRHERHRKSHSPHLRSDTRRPRSRSRSKTRHRRRSESRRRRRSDSRTRRRPNSRSRKRSDSRTRKRSDSRTRKRSDSRTRKRSDSKSRRRSGSRTRRRPDSKPRRLSHSKSRRQSRSKSRRRSNSRTRRLSRSKSRRRSNSRTRRRSRSKSRRSNSRTRRRSDSRSRRRSGSKTRKRSTSRQRHRSRSKSRHKTKSSRKSASRSRSKSTNKSRQNSPTKKKSRSRSKEKKSSRPSTKIDQAKILETARRNVLKMMKSGTMPEGLPVENIKKEQIISIQAGGKSVQELTDFCQRLSQKENEPEVSDKEDNDDKPDDATGFIHHPFKVKEPGMIKLNIKNAVQLPIKTHAQKIAETTRLSSQFPVSSGNQHKQKELEWVPVVPETAKTEAKSAKPPKPPEAPTPPPPEISKIEVPPEIPIPAIPPPPPPPPVPVSYCQPVMDSSQVEVSTAPPMLSPPPMPAFCMPPPLPPPSDQPTVFYQMPAPSVMQTYVTPNPPMVSYPSDPQPPPPPPPPMSSSSVFKPPKKLDIPAIVAKRFQALTKLQENPNDPEALKTIQDAQQSIDEWVQSQQVPGLFTGSTDAKVLSAAELCGPFKYYRPRKDLLSQAPPVTEGKGMSLLKKMGWNPGEGLGKNKEGSLEPLVLDIKTDKKGLVSEGENSKKIVSSFMKELQGKHPVSALMELCSKRKWKPPLYTCVLDHGPAHKKVFCFKVEVNGVEYQPVNPCSNKKIAKADAAVLCLQSLNLLPKNT